MHLAGWSLAAFVAVAALLLTQSAEVAGKADKSPETNSLEDELESSLPQPQPPQPRPQTQPQQEEQAVIKTAKTPQAPKQSPQQQPHHLEQQLERQKSDKPERQQNSAGHQPSREELREMFRELLESMSEAERKSLTLRLGRDSVKRTFSRMRDEARAEASTASVTKRAMPQEQLPAISHAKALRMRRSLLMGSMESGMSATRQRRKKRDLVDYSPEEYAQLVAMLAADRPKYIEDAEGNIRLEGDNDEEEEENDDAASAARDEQKRRADEDEDDEAEANVEERRPAKEAHGVQEVDTDEDVVKRRDDNDDSDEDADRAGVKISQDEAAADPEHPPLPPPPPPASPGKPSGESEPLTMFLVRMAGEKGLFVPLDQTRAQRLAVELAGEAAIAEVAEAQAAVEAAARDAAAAANAEAEADAERSRQEAGVAELKRFAEKLARRIPPGF